MQPKTVNYHITHKQLLKNFFSYIIDSGFFDDKNKENRPKSNNFELYFGENAYNNMKNVLECSKHSHMLLGQEIVSAVKWNLSLGDVVNVINGIEGSDLSFTLKYA